MAEQRLLFVCLGNICRSPAAEGVFLHLIEREGLEDRFLADVRDALDAPPDPGSGGMDPGMIAMLGDLDDASLEALIGAMAPGEGGGGMADVNRLLDQLAPGVRDRILVFYDDLLKRR